MAVFNTAWLGRIVGQELIDKLLSVQHILSGFPSALRKSETLPQDEILNAVY